MKYVVIVASSIYVGMALQTMALLVNDTLFLDLQHRRTTYKLKKSTRELIDSL